MTKLKLLGAVALLAATVTTPAMAQRWTNDYDYRYRSSGFWPGDVAAGVVGGAIGTAGAIATAPFRGSDSYAYYGGPAYDDSYAYRVQRPRSLRPACGIQPDATYMGPDGRWRPC
ncbi:hypothetical protein LJR220_003303 [Bradyrhizobium sp. LjRoot220]|uniref:hypothetical protein n=1 Tax=Bradyrhizobium sp. LjRoot220 TaxID=3342284 RepID=UPI003ECE0DDC